MSNSLTFCKTRASDPDVSPFSARPWENAVEYPDTETFFRWTLLGGQTLPGGSLEGFRVVYGEGTGDSTAFDIKLIFDGDARFEYFTSDSFLSDGTSAFLRSSLERVVHRVYTGGTYDDSKPRPKDGDTVEYTVGNFVILNEYDGDFVPPDEPQMRERTTVLLPLAVRILP